MKTNGTKNADVRIVYHRGGFESTIGHLVRHSLEATVCDWLIAKGIAHRHASEVFTVTLGPSSVPHVYVPDIVLHDKNRDGKTVIIEPLLSFAPKGSGTKVFAAFRKKMKKDYYVIVIARKNYMNKILKDAYDVLVDVDNLDLLLKRLPLPEG